MSSGTPSFASIVEHAPTALLVCDRSGRIRYANRASSALLGAGPNALVKTRLEELLKPRDAEVCRQALRSIDHGPPHSFEARLRREGPSCWCRITVGTLPSSMKGGDGIVLSFEDITALKRAITTLEEGNERYRLAVDRANDIIFNVDLSGRFTFVNPTACLLTKYQPDELVGRHFLTMIRPDARPAVEAFYTRQVRERIPSTYYEYPAVTLDGEILWLGQYVQLILDGSRVISVQAIARDITQRRHMEDALRTSEERLRAVVSSAPLILWVTDRSGRLTLCGGEALSDLGLEGDDLIGRSVSEAFDDPTLETHLARALDGQAFQVELSSGARTFDTWFSPARAQDGRVTGVIGVVADVTERQRLRTRLHELEKVEAVGRLAAGVAHDFNNQLTAVLGFAELLESTFGGSDPRREDVREIIKAGQRAAGITEQLLAYGRRQSRRPRIVKVGTVVDGIEPLLRRSMREDVVLALDLRDTEPVRVDPTQLEHVLVNLVLNARDALSPGGRLTISTSMTTVDATDARRMSMPAGPSVRIEVADTGHGMSEETRVRSFEPFFTTKELGKGTGLGLASVYGIVKQNGGHIAVESELGQGSIFTICLPVAEDGVDETTPPTAHDARVDGSETILLVEDDPSVRALASEALSGHGYEVLEASHPLEAIELVRDQGHDVDLLLTDMVMPVMSGRELSRRVRQLHPDVPVVYTTGYGPDRTAAPDTDASDLPIVEKPFVPSTLLRAVRAALDAASSRRADRNSRSS